MIALGATSLQAIPVIQTLASMSSGAVISIYIQRSSSTH
jgi:hypothetical protein